MARTTRRKSGGQGVGNGVGNGHDIGIVPRQASQPREQLLVISQSKGILQVVLPDGEVGYYRQRGIQLISCDLRTKHIQNQLLDPCWKNIPELPRKYSVYCEEPTITGRAYATYNPNRAVY